MIRRRHPRHGRGFTLLEMCVVLFIIALLVGLTLPSMHSAFVEQGVRRDAQQLAIMVKTAMIQSEEQHRAYVMELTDTTLALHPAAFDDEDADAEAVKNNPAAAMVPAPVDVSVVNELDPPNKLLFPDPAKLDKWIDATPTEWVFHPGELCPATRVRLTRGAAYIEMSFNALTGNVENEGSYVP
jgi:prepilin-type N-terminal cleavage/methylation domain-containing protein